MPIRLIAKIKQANDAAFSLLDDVDLKGGLRVVPTVPDLSLIPADFLKLGMLARVASTNQIYELTVLSPITWAVFLIGGGSGVVVYANEITLLADLGQASGTLGYATAENTFWIFNLGTWYQLSNPNSVQTYPSEVALLAATPASGTIGIVQVSPFRIYFYFAGVWNIPEFATVNGGTYP